MSSSLNISPGTVSKILWHFTGGPTWNAKTKRQNEAPKPAKDAYDNLISIVKTQVLKLGSYKEIVKIIAPERRRYDIKKKETVTETNVPVEITSSAVCCLSDIPAAHLRYHAYRYGKFAIGFYRKAVINHGFNPVFYTLTDTSVIRSIYEGFTALDFVDPWQIRTAADTIRSNVEDVIGDYEDIDLDVFSDVMDIEMESENIDSAIHDVKKSLEDFVAFVKTFEPDEFTSIYCEREWRSTKEYNFGIDDVAMIVIPKIVSKTRYYRDFVNRVNTKLKVSRYIPVVPWEDFVEH